MTTVISRLFTKEASARAVQSRLLLRGLPRNVITLFTTSDETIADRLIRAGVAEDTVTVYVGRIAEGNVLLLIRATYKPLGAARITREELQGSDTIKIDGDFIEESYVKDGPDHAPSVLKDHPHFLTRRSEPGKSGGGSISRAAGIRLLSPHKTKRSAISGGRFMSKMFWPMPLVTKNRRATSAIRGGGHMSRWFWPMPLISKNTRSNSVIRDDDQPLSRMFGWRTIGK